MNLLMSDPKAALGPATLADVPKIGALINRFAAQGLMLPKDRGELYRIFREYVVLTGEGGELLACGGLRIYTSDLAEICGLAVVEDAQGEGYGRTVVEALLEETQALGINRVFAMTLQEGFFADLGFEAVPRFTLPEKMEADCRGCARRVGCTEVAMLRRTRE